MATAQSLIVDAFVAQINSNANLNTRVIASSPSAGILRVTTRGADTPKADYLAAGSSVTGAGTFANKAPTGSPRYAEVWFSWTLAPGDTVKLNVGTTVQGIDLTYQLPANTVVDPGGFNHTTLGTGGNGVAVGGSGIGSAQHRRLVVMECGSASASFGSLFALDPQDATGIAIPTFRVTNALPTAGSAVGEALFVTATRSGFVWDGNGWRDVTASPIRNFPNDATLQQDVVEAVGVYAVATDTGNMYIRVADGWRRIGVAEFATYADLNAWNAAIGTQAISRDLNVLFLRVEDAPNVESWIPISQLVKTQAQVLAAPNIAGLTAVALDTGRRFVNNGVRWIEDPIEHYPTETALLASVPTDGHLAWADDTSVVFLASGNRWHRLQGPQITYGTTAPTTPGVGDFWFDSNANRQTLNIWTGTAWMSSTGVTVGGRGSRLIIPGYDNENPSATATADDIGGIAFRYNGTQTQLFLNKGTAWNAMTPMLGNPTNAGKAIVADAAGNMTWGTPVGGGAVADAIIPADPTTGSQPITRGSWLRVFPSNDAFITSASGAVTGSKPPGYAHYSRFAIDNKSDACPVPTNLRSSSNKFRVTIYANSQGAVSGEYMLKFYYEDGGRYFTKQEKGWADSDVIYGETSYVCSGNLNSLQWLGCLLYTNGSAMLINQLVITWELTNFTW